MPFLLEVFTLYKIIHEIVSKIGVLYYDYVIPVLRHPRVQVPESPLQNQVYGIPVFRYATPGMTKSLLFDLPPDSGNPGNPYSFSQ